MPAPAPRPGRLADGGCAAGDRRFEALLGPADWARLPPPIRRRFGRPLRPAHPAVYAGTVAFTRLSRLGWWLAALARLIGAPLPLASGGRAAACVVVVEDPRAGGQRWTRLYERPGRPAQVIHSIKRFAGPTGLEECVGGGIGVRLTLAVEGRSLVFRSAGYCWRRGQFSFALPGWLTPGRLEVRHREERAGRFSFTLRLTHPWFGVLIEQVGFFEDCPAGPPSRRLPVSPSAGAARTAGAQLNSESRRA